MSKLFCGSWIALLAGFLPNVASGQVDPLSGGIFEIYTDATLTAPGLTGSYVNQNLRLYLPQDDWRVTQPIAGTRMDLELDFTNPSWGVRAEVGLTGGSDANWEDFSVQWDGYIHILTDGMQVATISDDSSRMWIDLNDDGAFDATGPEFTDNHWGTPQAATRGELSVPLSVGVYRIRVQYEESGGGNVMQLVSPAQAIARIAYLIPSNRVPQADGVSKLQQFVGWMRDWMCEQMDRNGFGPRTLRIETESDGVTPKVHVVNLAETDDFLQVDVWGRGLTAADSAGVPLWTPGEIWLLVPEIHEQQPNGSLLGGVALGASFGSGNDPGVSMIGSVLLALGPQSLTDDRLYGGLVLPEIGPAPLVQGVSFPSFEGPTLSSVTSSLLGAMMHEWLHGLGMPHDFRNDANFHGNLMGNGLRGMRGSLFPQRYFTDDTRLAYGAALALRSSRYLTSCAVVAPPGQVTAPQSAPVNQRSMDLMPVVESVELDSHLLGETYPSPTPLPTRPLRGDPPAAECDDSIRPTLQILTTGAVDPADGLLWIDFDASDNVELATAHLRRSGDLISELELTGTDAATAFATPFHSTAQTEIYSISVYDTCGNRTDAETAILVNSGFNRAPQPFFRILKSRSPFGSDVLLNANGTNDPDHANSSIEVEWDLDDDGVYDTAPTTTKTLSVTPSTIGARRIRMRATDPAGAHSVSTAIALRIGNTDCNLNGIEDLVDIASGTSQDCNVNEMPDECDPDCNSTGYPDDCDVLAGTSPDCNSNGIPDECDSAGGTGADCNGNSVPDECDIAGGTSSDCNSNSIPDECDPDCNLTNSPDDCDVISGTSPDCNTNGIPDECEPDCNTTGYPDDCDVFAGTSSDCDSNGLPDECDPDCNSNNIPDNCEEGDLIDEQPVSQVLCLGETAQFAVTALAADSFQWFKNGVALEDSERITGVAETLLIIENASPADDGWYSCRVGQDCLSQQSDNATLTVALPAEVIANPVAELVRCSGTTLVLDIEARGTDLTFVWQKDDQPLVNDDRVSGADTANLRIVDITRDDAGEYRCVATDSCGDSDVSQPTDLVVADPVWVTQPTNTCANLDELLVLTGMAEPAIGHVGYIWQKDGTSLSDGGRISGSATDTLRIENAEFGDAGTYALLGYSLPSPVCVVTSEPAIVSIGDCPCASTSACPNADVDCNGIVDEADLGLITDPANWGRLTSEAAEPRSDVDGDGIVNGLDIARAVRSDCYGL